MTKQTFAISLLLTLSLAACSPGKKSRVLSFEYGTYTDTSCAMMHGEVYKANENPGAHDSLLPLTNVLIEATDSAKIYKAVTTDNNGRFSICFLTKGSYNLTVIKEGFQSAKITNYLADTGQVSTVKIILEKKHIAF